MSLTLTPGRLCNRRRIRARASEARPRTTSGRSAGSITRKLRDIIRPGQLRAFCISFSDIWIIHLAAALVARHRLSEPPMHADAAGRRATLTLDGLWDFEFEGPTVRLRGGDDTIRSPGIWQAQLPALRNAQGTGRYRRGVQIPPGWAGKRIVLVMEGVFHESVILVDEVAVAVHGDGWTPIEVDLTDALDRKTSFVLGVDARVPDDRNGGRFSLSLAGKQDWYGVQGGIWKPARLEARDPVHLSEVEVQCSYDLATGVVTVKGRLSQLGANAVRLALSRAGDAVAHGDFPLDGATFLARLTTPNPDPWSPHAPNLYDVAVELIRDGAVVDSVERTVGFRLIEAKEGRLVLNG